MDFDDVRPIVATLVATVDSEPDAWEDETEDALANFFDHSFFFFDRRCWNISPGMRTSLVSRVAKLISSEPNLSEPFFVSDNDDAASGDFKPEKFLSVFPALLEGKNVTLRSLVFARLLLDRIAQHPTADVNESLFLNKHKKFSEERFSIPDNSVYPALYCANRQKFAELKTALHSGYMNKKLGRSVPNLIFNDGSKGPDFFKLIQNGPSDVKRGKGQKYHKKFRFTKYKALWIYARIRAACNLCMITAPAFDELFCDDITSHRFETGGTNLSEPMPIKRDRSYVNDLHEGYADRSLPAYPLVFPDL